MRFAPSTRAAHRRPGGGGNKRTDAGGGPRPFLDGYSTYLRAFMPVRDSLLKFEDECRAWVHLLLQGFASEQKRSSGKRLVEYPRNKPHHMDPIPSAGVKILFLLGWMDIVVARSRQVVVLAM